MRSPVARFRLRFLLQEFDLTGSEVVIGRSPECPITIEDPLVSREHARIRIEDGNAYVEDLGSRNGVRLNGEKLEGPAGLGQGDRIRLGTQELVFLVVDRKEREARTTGFMSTCASCGTPYPEQAKSCPHCGAEQAEDDATTMSGLSVEPRNDWTFQLLGEVIERALGAGRATEADRLVRRAAKEIDDQLESNGRLEEQHLSAVADYALRLAQLNGELDWVSWALDVHRKQQQLPSSEVMDRLEQMSTGSPSGLGRLVGEFLQWARQQTGQGIAAESTGLRRLEQLAQGH
jgi:predicted component of type VI protein secretion system